MARSLSCLAWAVAFAFGGTGYGSFYKIEINEDLEEIISQN